MRALLEDSSEQTSIPDAPIPRTNGATHTATVTTIVPERTLPILRIGLEYVPDQPNQPSFSLEFDVGEVCVREHYISLLVTSDLGFKPTETMRFRLKFGNRMYPVIFAGSEFEFKSVQVRGISFLRDKAAEEK